MVNANTPYIIKVIVISSPPIGIIFDKNVLNPNANINTVGKNAELEEMIDDGIIVCIA